MDLFIKISLLILFLFITILVGFYCKKKTKTTDGFIIGGRNVGPWLTAFAYGTSYFSAVIFVGYSGQFGWKFGISAIWIGIGNALIGSLLAWIILGRRTRLVSQKLDSKTMPDFFGKRFNSNKLKIAASLIVFVFLIPYTASLYNGLSRLFSIAFPINYEICIVLMAIVTAIYVLLGGFLATAINDFIQGIIMIFGIVAVIIAVLNLNGGFEASINALLSIPPSNTDSSIPGIYGSLFGANPHELLMIVLFTSLGTWGLPQMIAKFYSIKDENQIKKGTIISTIFALIVAGGCYFLGGFSRLFSENVEYNNGTVLYDSIIPSMISKLPAIFIAIVVILVLAASMSTLSSLVLSSSSTITFDIVGNKKKYKNEKREILLMRIFVVIFIIISAIIAIIQSKSKVTFIAQLMGISWGALAGAFLGPYLYGLYWKKASNLSVWICFIFSCVFMILNIIFNEVLPQFLKSPINCGVICIFASLLLVPIISLFSKSPNKEIVDDIFSCYEAKCIGLSKDYLGE